MDKNILNEINRGREIMGLGQLITEANDYQYDIKGGKELQDNFDKIEKKVIKKTIYKNGVSAIPGYDDLLNKIGQKRFSGRFLKGNKVTVEEIVVAIVYNLGDGSGGKGLKEFINKLNDGWAFILKDEGVTVQTKGGNVLTRGSVRGNGKVNIDGKKFNSSSQPPVLVSYMNGYNVRYFAEGGDKGWDLKEMNDKGFMNFMNGPGSQGPYLYLYAVNFGSKQTADSGTITDTQKGYQATGHYETDYASGESTPDEKLVAKAVKEIGIMFPADVANELDVFTLKAGASANWGDKTTLPDSEGRGDTGYAEGNEGKNQKLAFDRGNNFMMAVNKGLKAGGHPGFDNYEVQWVVKGQDKSSQFIDLMLDIDKKDKIKTRIIGTVISGDKTEKAGKNKIQRFEVTFADMALEVEDTPETEEA
tara:strand:- start:360 stop:1613 length:1254 start_codon:yes stop_codon:yes gene_type:complete